MTVQISDGTSLILRFPPGQVPYLGVLVNEGGWAGMHNATLEPCTAPYDRIDAANAYNRCSVVKSKSNYKWWLEFVSV